MGWQDDAVVARPQANAPAWQQDEVVPPKLGNMSSQVPNDIAPPTPAAPQKSLLRRAGDAYVGVGEAGLSMLSSIPAAFAAQIAGIGSTLTSGKFGTPEGIRQGQETAGNVSQAMTYQPRTDSGREILTGVGEAIGASKLAGIGPAEGVALSGTAGPAIAQVRQNVGQAIPRVRDALRPQPQEIPGFGAAMASPGALRQETAAGLPVPIQLTKGQIDRGFEIQRFERETAKMGEVGEPLRQRFAQQNESVLRNFDAWIDQTGAQTPDLRATGQIVTKAVADKMNKAKLAINEAYENARASGEMNQPVQVKPLLDYVNNKRPESVNAPVISSLEQKVAQLMAPDGTISVNGLEEVRKMVGALSGKDATNAHFGKEIKQLIDTLTDGVGGDEYRRARALRTRYANEFENVGVVDKLMSTKPGTKDRSVAYEDVFQHSILSGSLDDVRAIRRTLQTAGGSGEQAWKELQGQTINYLKESASKNAQRDIRDNPIVSFAGFDKAVRHLDADGKLDFIFGKQGGQQIRDLRELSADIFTSPPGAVNTSNTTSTFWRLLQSLPGAKTVGVAKDLYSSREIRQQVNESLNPQLAIPRRP